MSVEQVSGSAWAECTNGVESATQKQQGPQSRPYRAALSLLQPALNSLGAILFFPSFQYLVVAAFSFYNFTVIWVLVTLQNTLTTSTFHRRCGGLGGIRIEEGDNVAQGVVVVGQQGAQFGFKLDLTLEFLVAFQGFEALLLLGDLGFQSFVFGND